MNGDQAGTYDEDPGWHLGWRTLLVLVPYSHVLYRRRTRGDPLVNLRNVYLSFPGSLILFGFVIPFTLPLHGQTRSGYFALGIGVLTVVYAFIVPRIERPLPCESGRQLAAAYRARMFLRIAFANTPALFGFVAAFITRSSWIYYACLIFSVPGLVRAAPTKAALVREQDELTARGCDRSLVAALRSTPPASK